MAHYTETRFEEACREQGRSIQSTLHSMGAEWPLYWRAKQKGRYTRRFAERAASALCLPVEQVFSGYVPNKRDPSVMTPGRLARHDPIAAFWTRVDKTGDCWFWTGGGRTKCGHGRSSYPGAGGYAHRASWLIHFGTIPDGLDVLHSCTNPACVRPDHLWLGTQQDNNRLRDARGHAGPHNPCRGEAHPQARLTEATVLACMQDRAAGLTYSQLGKKYGHPGMTIWGALTGHTWRHVTGLQPKRREENVAAIA